MDWNDGATKDALAKMRTRYSCRDFDEREIPEDLLKEILQTGLCAASGGNLQPYSILVVREQEAKEKLCVLCEDQAFIAKAPVNLLFLLDWHKMGVYAKAKDAPFTCHESYMHFLIGLEDVMCAAQSIETAAHLTGIESCYVGNANDNGRELAREFNLPEYTYPVLLLSMGYPKSAGTVVEKLGYDIMVFNESYPDLTSEEITAHYDKKYAHKEISLPKTEPYRSETLVRLKNALLTTYSVEDADRIIAAACETGRLAAVQRIFGLHYEAGVMQELGRGILSQMYGQGLKPFEMG